MKKSLVRMVWECKYHIVWVTKKQRKIVQGKLRQEIETRIPGSGKQSISYRVKFPEIFIFSKKPKRRQKKMFYRITL